jgi:hypothetical protein
MSNPLLKPNDPRFQRPEVRDEAGKNRFGDEQAGEQPAAGGEYAATGDARPYQPQYEAQQPARNGLLLTLAIFGGACGLVGSMSLLNVFISLGWLLPLLGLILAMSAWFLAHQDRQAARVGALAAAGLPLLNTAYWLSLLAIVLCLSVVISMIWRGLSFLPDLF